MTDEVIQGTDDEQPEVKQPEVKQTFDDFLKDPKYQSDFDKRVQKALETAKTKWDADANLSAEERARKQLSEQVKAIEEREQAQDKREFIADIREDLTKNGLPTAFAEIIADGTGRDGYPDYLQGIKSEWDRQMNEQIKARARQRDPQASDTVQDTPTFSIAEFANKIREVK